MDDTITLESVRRLDVKPGDVLAITTGYELDPQEAAEFAAQLREVFDPSIKVLILTPGTRVDILAPVA